MTLIEFKRLSETEQNIFISKLLHAVKNSAEYFMYADSVVSNAELDGLFHNVRFGIDAFKEPAY